jgi:hypothetical protein
MVKISNKKHIFLKNQVVLVQSLALSTGQKIYRSMFFIYFSPPSPKVWRGVGGEGMKCWDLHYPSLAPLTPQFWGEQDLIKFG